MMAFVQRYDIHTFDVLADYSAKYNEAWFDTLTSKRTLFMKEYLKSRTWRLKNREYLKNDNQENIIDIIHEKEEKQK